MSDEYEGTSEFQVRQVAVQYPTHYLSTSVERNSKGFTTAVKATNEIVGDENISDVEVAARIQRVNNLLLAVGQYNIEYRKLLITLGESMSSHDEAVAQAKADFERLMADYTQPVGG